MALWAELCEAAQAKPLQSILSSIYGVGAILVRDCQQTSGAKRIRHGYQTAPPMQTKTAIEIGSVQRYIEAFLLSLWLLSSLALAAPT
jgi:hypothetical protein